MALICEFTTQESARAFAQSVEAVGYLTESHEDAEKAERGACFPFRLDPPIVLVGEYREVGPSGYPGPAGHLDRGNLTEADIEEMLGTHGGVYVGN